MRRSHPIVPVSPAWIGWQRPIRQCFLAARSSLVFRGHRQNTGAAGQTAGRAAILFANRSPSSTASQKPIRSIPTGSSTSLLRIIASLGSVQVKQGKLSDALASYTEQLAIIQRVLKLDPKSIPWQRDLAGAYRAVGGVQSAQGHLQGALAFYRQGFAILEPLAKADPDNSGLQRESRQRERRQRRCAGRARQLQRCTCIL